MVPISLQFGCSWSGIQCISQHWEFQDKTSRVEVALGRQKFLKFRVHHLLSMVLFEMAPCGAELHFIMVCLLRVFYSVFRKRSLFSQRRILYRCRKQHVWLG